VAKRRAPPPVEAAEPGSVLGPATYVRTAIYMDTAITIEVVGASDEGQCSEHVARAFGWFAEVERRCSRFDPTSELSRLSERAGAATPVSPLLWHVLEFALAVAGETGGAFDPTVGAAMESNGFDRNYRTGEHHRMSSSAAPGVTYRDILLDPSHQTVTLARPLVLDLGAVAKGFAMDLAGKELGVFSGFAINAGGDLLVHGQNASAEPWRIGIRHPRELETLVETVELDAGAVCTSGDYERPRPAGDGHHIIEPQSGRSVRAVASVTAIAPTALLADAIATAAFVLGPASGIELFERHGVEGLILSPDMTRFETSGFRAYCR
jgi:thiamine biosynthesis lipoprotein